MTTLAALILLALPAHAQKPAKKAAAPPDAPSATLTPIDADTKKRLNDALFLPKTGITLPARSDSQRLPKLDDEKWENVGHKDVTAELQVSPQGRDFDAFPQGTGPYDRTKTQSVELSFIQPAPGMTLGVGYSERKEWIGGYRGPTQTAGFAVLRVTLGPSERKPTVFLPEARVSERKDFQGEKVEHYSIDDLPSGLRP